MDVDPGGIQPDADNVGPGGADLSGEPGDPFPLLRIDRVYRVVSADSSTYFDGHSFSTVYREDVDFPTSDSSVGCEDGETLVLEEPNGETLPVTTYVRSTAQQPISGGRPTCSSCSTLTSRKVSTWTC